MKIGIDNGGNWTAEYYEATVVSVVDYYPFGSAMAGRKYNQGTYRYGFNGVESVPELKEGHNTTFFREQDTRIGRWWSIDPKTRIFESPYVMMGNNPIMYADMLGDSINPTRTKAMNFIVVATKDDRKGDAAYTADYLKAKQMKASSFGKLNVIEANNSDDAVNQIIDILGDEGYIDNITFDFHVDKIGNERINHCTYETFSLLSDGYIGKGSVCYLGHCWGGGNSTHSDYTADFSKAFDGALTYGNKAAASSITFVLFGHFTGVIPEGYSTSPKNTEYLGMHTVSAYDSETQYVNQSTTRNFIKITNSGKIKERAKMLQVNVWGKSYQGEKTDYKARQEMLEQLYNSLQYIRLGF